MSELDNIHLTYIGGPTILIEVGALRLLTDPTFDPPGNYETGAFTHSKLAGPAISASEIGSVDVVLLSHDHHFDNLDRAGRKLLSVAKRVITTPAGAQRLQRNAIGLESWQSFDVSASDGKIFSITSTPARHGPVIGERGPVAGFLISYKDSTEDLIYVSGDTVWYEGVQETLRRYPNIRVGILFVGTAQIPVLPAHLTFTAEEAVRVSTALPRAIIVPVHFEGWKHLKESRQDLTQAFSAAGREDRLLWLQPGKSTALGAR
jgi:L-ascorbate metabolism protein UlaG (beta-lactamase superfamily)